MAEKSAPERFNETAANYTTSAHHVGGRSLTGLLEAVGPSAGQAILDVACGSGHNTLAFARRVRRAVACDPAPNMLRETLRFGREGGAENIEACRGLAEALPFREASFDAVVARIAPHHFADIERAVREMARATRPGGVVAISDLCGWEDPEVDAFNHELEMLHDPTHVRSYTPARWRAIFEGAGLRVVHDEQVVEPAQGLLASEWCRVAATPAGNAGEIVRRSLAAPEKIRRALGIEAEGGEVRLRQRRIEIIAGRR